MKSTSERMIFILSVVVVLSLVMSLFPAIVSAYNQFGMAREQAKASACLANVKQMCTAMMMYAQDNNDKMPISSSWNAGLEPYIKNNSIYICPSAPKKSPAKGIKKKPILKYSDTCYAMNKQLSRIPLYKVTTPSYTVSIFESVQGKNQQGGSTLLPIPPRHPSGYSFGFADGHCKSVPQSAVSTLKWTPK
ncbi:MAG: hypothetical protein ACYC27_17635 [Armatimonadota bacterium]